MMEVFSDVYSNIILLVTAFCIIQFFDIMFKTCMFHPYLVIMNNLGIVIKPYMIVWRTTRLNKAFRIMGQCMPSLLKKWFNVGIFLSILSMFVALGLLIMPVIDHLSGKLPSNHSNGSKGIVSTIPGITTPASHLVYIIPAIILSVIFHEFGHALAASREKVPVENCGLALTLLFPAAFVNLDFRRLNVCSAKQKLRVYSAGVWHNLVLLLLSLLFLNYSSSILYPYFQTGKGITVLNVEKHSGLAYVGGFTKGDVLSSINNCEVTDLESWFKCLEIISASPQLGFCSSMEFIQSYGNISHCCTNSSTHLCFKMVTKEVDDFVCLPARKTIEKEMFCRNNSDCLNKLCLMPFLLPKQKLVQVERHLQKSVLFIGAVEDFLSVKISSYVSDVEFPSIELITHLEMFFKYFAGLSGGLIIVNVMPCYYLDGGHIIEHLLVCTYKLFKRKLDFDRKEYLATRFKIVGSVLLIVNIILGLKNLKIINL